MSFYCLKWKIKSVNIFIIIAKVRNVLLLVNIKCFSLLLLLLLVILWRDCIIYINIIWFYKNFVLMSVWYSNLIFVLPIIYYILLYTLIWIFMKIFRLSLNYIFSNYVILNKNLIKYYMSYRNKFRESLVIFIVLIFLISIKWTYFKHLLKPKVFYLQLFN